MKGGTINLLLGVWGTLTGTLALLIQYLGYLSDRASLRVAAAMSYGSSEHFGREQKHFMTVRLTNSGRSIVRIRSIALRINAPWRIAVNGLLFKHQFAKRVVQPDIGIYSGAVDPIHEIMQDPRIKSYPPPTVVLDENQTIELRLIVSDDLLPLLPKRKAWVVVTDHVGAKHKARYFPIDCRKKMETDSQHSAAPYSETAERSPQG